MPKQLECEVKALVNKKDFNHLMDVYRNKGYLRDQDNIYFGDTKGIFKANKLMMRIRIKENNIKITLKIPQNKGLLEINQLIDEETKEKMLTKSYFPDGEVLDSLKTFGLEAKDMIIIGRLSTTRLVVQDNEYELCLDENHYGNKVDYEVEVEGPSISDARQYLKNILEEEKILFNENLVSKYIRAIN